MTTKTLISNILWQLLTDELMFTKIPLNNNKLQSYLLYLPDGVCMFAIFGRTPMDSFFFLYIVDTHTTIIETDSDHVGMLRVDIQTHYSTVSFIDVLSKGGVLQGEEENHSTALLHEVICNVTKSCQSPINNEVIIHSKYFDQSVEEFRYLYEG